jgi:hypothetical protein
MIPLFVPPFTLLVVLASSTGGGEAITQGMSGGKAPLRLAAQKSRPHVPFAPMRNTPAYFLCKWGE